MKTGDLRTNRVGATIDMIRTLESDLPLEDMTDMEEAMIGMAGLVTTGTVRHVIITTETHTDRLKRGMLRHHVTTIGMHPQGGMTVMNGDPQGNQAHQEGTLITPLVTIRHKGGLILLRLPQDLLDTGHRSRQGDLGA